MKFKCILTAVLLSATWAAAQTPGSLKASYPFSGNSLDMSGQNNDGQIAGNVFAASDRFGQSNCAYLFPGDTGSYIEVPLSADFSFTPTQAFTISLWYQGGSPAAGDRECLWSEKAGFSEYFFGLYDVNRVLFHQCWAPMSSTIFPNPDTAWHHAVAVYDNGDFTIYRDNQLLVSQPAQPAITVPPPTHNIVIGRGFLGKIDDVRYYNEALDTSAVSSLYAMPGSCLPAVLPELKQNLLVSIYPNPASGFIQVQLKEPVKTLQVSLYTIHGRLIKELSFRQTGSARVDIRDVATGCYLLHISDGINSRSKVVQKIE